MYPSVTTVLKPFSDFSTIPPAVLENAARRGTAAHSLFAAYALGLFMPTPPGELAGYFASFKTWFDDYVDCVFFVEKKFVDEKLGFCGHADAGLRLIDGRTVVVDWKTPAVTQKSWEVQTAAYLHLAQTQKTIWTTNGVKITIFWDGYMSLQLRADGGPAKANVYKNSHMAFSIFLSALNCYKFFKGGNNARFFKS